MKKAFDFIQSLKPVHFDLLGYPTLKFFSDYVEVYFDSSNVIRELDILRITGYDEMRFFAGDGCITFVYTFNNDNES